MSDLECKSLKDICEDSHQSEVTQQLGSDLPNICLLGGNDKIGILSMLSPNDSQQPLAAAGLLKYPDKYSLSQIMDNMLNSCDERIHKKIMKLWIQSREEIHGPTGASKPKQTSGPVLVKSINKIFDKLEQHLLDELNKIKQIREDIIKDIST